MEADGQEGRVGQARLLPLVTRGEGVCQIDKVYISDHHCDCASKNLFLLVFVAALANSDSAGMTLPFLIVIILVIFILRPIRRRYRCWSMCTSARLLLLLLLLLL